MSRQVWIGLSTSLVALSWSPPAGAQPQVLTSAGERSPGKRAEMLFAARMTKALSLPLQRVSGLLQPAGAPHPLANDPLAERDLRGTGTQVVLAGLIVVRLRFETPREAQVAALLLGPGARVDPRQPRCVTQASGPNASPEVLTKVESVASEGALPADLATTLGQRESVRRSHTRTLRIPRPVTAFAGVELHLKDLWVLRLRFPSEVSAGRFLEEHVGPRAERQVAEQRGLEVLLLGGAALSQVALARKALLAAWRAGESPRGKRGVLGVWIGKRAAEHERYAVFSAPNGARYQQGADLLRAFRAPTKASATTLEWQFSDPETKNQVLFWTKSIRPGFTRHGGVLATSEGILHASAPTRERREEERRYLLGLLEAVGQRLPRAIAQVPLPERR